MNRQWLHLVVATDVVQGVFGAALYIEADQFAKKLTADFPFAAASVHTVHGERPTVGSSYSAQLGIGRLYTSMTKDRI